MTDSQMKMAAILVYVSVERLNAESRSAVSSVLSIFAWFEFQQNIKPELFGKTNHTSESISIFIL